MTWPGRFERQDAAAARVLAGAADRDVTAIRAEIRDFRRATNMSFNALRQDMNEGFRRIDKKFALMDNRFVEVLVQFDLAAAGQQRIIELIQTVIDARGRNSSA